MNGSSLPKISKEEKGDIALRLITSDIIYDGNWFARPNDTRRRLIATAKAIEVDPNKLLSMLQELTEPKLAEIFKPISAEDITAYEKEREERRKQREIQKVVVTSLADSKREALAQVRQ